MRKHVLEEAGELEKAGMDKSAAWRQASYRVFGDPPGAHGAGTGAVLEAKIGKRLMILLQYIPDGAHMLMVRAVKAHICLRFSKGVWRR